MSGWGGVGNEPEIVMEQGFDRLERVNDVALAEGRIRQATPAERPLLEIEYKNSSPVFSLIRHL
ncbi:hypothetical protein ACW7EJ_06820 [Acinetobacter soli]